MDVINLINECMELDYIISQQIRELHNFLKRGIPYSAIRYWGQPLTANDIRYDEYDHRRTYIEKDLMNELHNKILNLQDAASISNDKRGLAFVNRLSKSLEAHFNALRHIIDVVKFRSTTSW